MSTSQQASSSSTLPPRQDTSFNDSIPTLVHIDPHRPGQEQKNIHTRWHPDIPCVADIPLGKPFRVECIDYSGGQVCNDDCADDVLDLNHDSDHHISGPFNVPNARAGDILEIEIIDIRPFRSQPWGYSVTSPGLGSLDHPDHPTQTTKSIWDFRDEETSSRHVPRVQFVGRPHPGIMGTAPSLDLLSEWNRREKELYDVEMEKGRDCGVTLPLRKGAYVGQDLDEELRYRIYTQGARTGPARENGGNIDISSWVKGSKVYLPVFVPGAKFSVGDLHFSEGDGEPTTAIEMSGIITLQINVIPSTSPLATSSVYLSSPTEPTYPRRLVFTGLSLTPQGAQTNMGGMEAYRRACFDAIDYLVRFGWTREQAYIILSVVPVETRVVATANKPNFVVSLGLPLDAFTIDISPAGLGSAPYRIDGPAYPSKERLERVDNNAHGNGH